MTGRMMGREAKTHGSWPGGEGQVSVHLDGEALTFRGGLSRKIPRSAIRAVEIDDETLVLVMAGETITLDLGTKDASLWRKAILTEPPTLAKKLGISDASRLKVLGAITDQELTEALLGIKAGTDLLIADVADAADLAAALQAHAKLSDPSAPIWIIHRKGRAASFGETLVRAAMREAGFKDVKVAAVSARSTALKFVRHG